MLNTYTHDKHRFSRSRWSCALLGLLAVAAACAEAAPVGPESVEAIVNGLVNDALAANLELEAAGAGVDERLAALDQARARYLPALDLSARYTRANGGRAIDIPVGDLLNPVYASLNQLTGAEHFAPVQNQKIDFQRTREQQTDLSLTQPLYDARIGAARAAARANFDAAQAARTALSGRIQRDMRQAYYRWLQSRASVGIYSATLDLAKENRRVTDSLNRNGKITRDLVYRAEADELEIEQLLLDSRSRERLAQSYVNLLRHAPFDRELPPVPVEDADARSTPGVQPIAAALPALQDSAVAQRAELRERDAEAAAAEAGERLARAAFKPQVALAFDYGIQGEQYGFSGEERYWLASVVMKFSFFAGGGDRAGIAGAHAALHAARAARESEEQAIRFHVQQALQDLEVARATLDTAGKRVDAAAGAFRIAAKKRDLGQINQAEFIDARRALTDAQLNLNITRCGALIDLAELQYALGTDPQRFMSENLP